VLEAAGLAEYRPNPAHRRAKLLTCSEAGYWAVGRISLVQHPWANGIGGAIGAAKLESALETIRELTDAIDAGRAEL
jgi:hypothetical protein